MKATHRLRCPAGESIGAPTVCILMDTPAKRQRQAPVCARTSVSQPSVLTKTVAAVVTAVLVSLFQTAPALSNGAAVEIFRGRDGAYEVVVAILPEEPTVGTVHFSITPSVAETSVPVTDAKIIVVAIDPENEPAYQARALNSPDSPRSYDANITFESQGTWTVSVEIRSDGAGDATVVFPLELGPQPLESSPAGAVVLLAVMAVLIGGGVYVWYSSRRRRQATSVDEIGR